jgi:hypothetical protein
MENFFLYIKIFNRVYVGGGTSRSLTTSSRSTRDAEIVAGQHEQHVELVVPTIFSYVWKIIEKIQPLNQTISLSVI